MSNAVLELIAAGVFRSIRGIEMVEVRGGELLEEAAELQASRVIAADTPRRVSVPAPASSRTRWSSVPRRPPWRV